VHQYALLGKGASIHSPSQLEWYNNDVNDKPVHVPGGLQWLTTLDGYVIPLTIKDGLVRLDIWPHTDHEYETLPHVCLTSKIEWAPLSWTMSSLINHNLDKREDNPALVDIISASSYNEFGQYRHRVDVNKYVYFSRFKVTILMTISTNAWSLLTLLTRILILLPSIAGLQQDPPFLWLVGC
jgi:hypothetical protein